RRHRTLATRSGRMTANMARRIVGTLFVVAANALATAARAQDQAAPAAAAAAAPDVTVGNALLPHDLSPWGMFLNADLVVKAVIIGLAFASLVTWTVWLAETVEAV